jgi:hypothetical protein
MSTDTMYAASDPRSKLSTAQSGSTLSGKDAAFSAAEYALFGQSEPQVDDANGKTWLARGQNFIVAYTEAKPGGSFVRTAQVDEYVLLIEAREPHAVVSAGTETVEIPGAHITIVPPGDSNITFPDGGAFVRLFTTASDDLVALCSNREAYALPHPHIPPLQRWPDPPAGVQDPQLQPRRDRAGGAVRPDLALHHLHGQRVRARRPARHDQALAAPS